MAVTYPTVLIVEDEPIVRMYEAELAEGAGFITHQATNANEALRTLNDVKPIHILLTDLNMPGDVDGVALATQVHKQWPHIKIVVVSSYVNSSADDVSGITYLHKPFTQYELVSTLLGVV